MSNACKFPLFLKLSPFVRKQNGCVFEYFLPAWMLNDFAAIPEGTQPKQVCVTKNPTNISFEAIPICTQMKRMYFPILFAYLPTLILKLSPRVRRQNRYASHKCLSNSFLQLSPVVRKLLAYLPTLILKLFPRARRPNRYASRKCLLTSVLKLSPFVRK